MMKDSGEFLTGMMLGAVLGAAFSMFWVPSVRKESHEQMGRWRHRAQVTSDDILDRFRDRLRQIRDGHEDGGIGHYVE